MARTEQSRTAAMRTSTLSARFEACKHPLRVVTSTCSSTPLPCHSVPTVHGNTAAQSAQAPKVELRLYIARLGCLAEPDRSLRQVESDAISSHKVVAAEVELSTRVARLGSTHAPSISLYRVLSDAIACAVYLAQVNLRWHAARRGSISVPKHSLRRRVYSGCPDYTAYSLALLCSPPKKHHWLSRVRGHTISCVVAVCEVELRICFTQAAARRSQYTAQLSQMRAAPRASSCYA